jgi:S1 RNA binding domain protein
MELGVGTVIEGKVTGITKFGAFIALPSGKTGLVHISEIANSYVTDIKEHLKEGQDVKVKIIGVDSAGRINLSIKKAVEPEPFARHVQRAPAYFPTSKASSQKEQSSFEDKLKQFMQDSDSKISDLKQYAEKKGGPTRRGRK